MWGLSGCWKWFWASSSPSRAASSIPQKIICSGDREITDSEDRRHMITTWTVRRCAYPCAELKTYAGSVATRMPISSEQTKDEPLPQCGWGSPVVCRVIQSGFQSDCPRVNREPSFPNARKPRKAGRGLGIRLPCMRDTESDPRWVWLAILMLVAGLSLSPTRAYRLLDKQRVSLRVQHSLAVCKTVAYSPQTCQLAIILWWHNSGLHSGGPVEGEPPLERTSVPCQ